MRTASQIWFSLAAFLAIAGVVYGLTSFELAGAPLLLVGAATLCYLAFVARAVVRRSSAKSSHGASEMGDELEREAAEVHVAPTIWPFGFSIAAVVIVLGLVVGLWLLVVGVLAFAISAAGWLRDVARSHGHAEPP